jgi:hypothetical protein
MALFGSSRDISAFRYLNRELLGNVISQQCSFYKHNVERTNVNIYGEAAGSKYYDGPTLLYCLVDRKDQTFVVKDDNIDTEWKITFKLLRDDLVQAKLIPDIGDIILYQERYYEVDQVNNNQYIVGKNPDYPNEVNPLNPGLSEFGSNWAVICETHFVPSDKVGITKERT